MHANHLYARNLHAGELQPSHLHACWLRCSGGDSLRAYFLPGDWVLAHRPGHLSVTKLSTGEALTIEGAIADTVVAQELEPSTWTALARHEPVLGELHARIATERLGVLTRASLLRGAGWRQLFVELTARCNERCVHCYAESSPERTESLSLETIVAVLNDAKALGFETVQLTGGDPLVSPHCIAAAEYATRIGIPNLEVYTNGLALRGEAYERLRGLGVAFAFSFYSHDPSRHDAITRTPGSHRRTTRAIRQAVEDGLSVRTGTIMMGDNEGDAEDTREYLVQLGVKPTAVGIDSTRAVGRGDPPSSSERGQLYGGVERAGSHGKANARPFGGTAAVSYDGIVYPCIFSRHLPLGSIYDDSLKAILEAPEPVDAPTEDLLEARSAWASGLSCWECQTRSHLLGANLDG